MTFEERMENLQAIKETLMSEVKFYLNLKDWPKVTVRKRSLRDCDEQIARLRHRNAIAA